MHVKTSYELSRHFYLKQTRFEIWKVKEIIDYSWNNPPDHSNKDLKTLVYIECLFGHVSAEDATAIADPRVAMFIREK